MLREDGGKQGCKKEREEWTGRWMRKKGREEGKKEVGGRRYHLYIFGINSTITKVNIKPSCASTIISSFHVY